MAGRHAAACPDQAFTSARQSLAAATTQALTCTRRLESWPRPGVARSSLRPQLKPSLASRWTTESRCASWARTPCETSPILSRLYQVVASGLRAEFPPPRTESAAARTNLPIPLTRFVGRSRELKEVEQLVAGERLVTLTGPGGTGKTRLAIEVGRASLGSFPDGVFFVALDSVRDPDLVVPQIAQTLGLAEDASRPIADVLAGYLAGRHLLLILDNVEQVISAAPSLGGLVGAGPTFAILSSSREPLGVAGETVYSVPPLSLPSEPGTPTARQVASLEAVELFVERARGARPGFELTDENAAAVAAICRRVDGLPLAIELAAARVNVLSPQQILDRLDHRLTLLSGSRRDVTDRQRTLRGAIDWSHDLLSDDEKAGFRRFSGVRRRCSDWRLCWQSWIRMGRSP